jgi:hypothetical protein
MMVVKTGDEVVLSDGGKTKTFVAIGFTKFHVCLANKATYVKSMSERGEYCRMRYGYASIPLKTSGIQLGFWEMLQSVNGNQFAR